MKTIIVATDYSRTATNAVHYAAALAKQVGTNLTIINTYTLSVPKVATKTSLYTVKAHIAEEQEKLEKLVKEIAQTFAIVVEAVSDYCPIEEELHRQVKQRQADLVVMGMNGDSLSRRIFGSSTLLVLQDAQYPVLFVPNEVKFKGLQKLLLAFDYKGGATQDSISFLKELVLQFHATLKVVHIEKKPADADELSLKRNALEELNKMLSGITYNFSVVQAKHVLEGIEKEVKASNSDLLALIPHQYGGWGIIFRGSTTRKMIFSAHVPLLVLPELKQPVQQAPMRTSGELQDGGG